MMLTKFRTAFADESGQGLTEYIIIVALIAIAAIGVVSLFGDDIRRLFGASATALSGNETTKVKTMKSSDQVAGHRNLQTFGKTKAGKANQY